MKKNRFVLLIIFIFIVSSFSVVYGFEPGGGHGGGYDSNAYWPTQSDSIRLSNEASLKNPALKFAFQHSGSINGAPVVGREGTIYFNTSSKKLYAVNPDGTQKWAVDCGTVDVSPVIGKGGVIYVASDEGVIAFNSDGTRKWTNPRDDAHFGQIINDIALDQNGDIYITERAAELNDYSEPVNTYYIRKIHKDTGNSSWSRKWSVLDDPNYENSEMMESYNGSSPAIGKDGTVYVLLGNRLVARDSLNGDLKWDYYFGVNLYNYSKITLTDEGLYINIYHSVQNGRLYYFNSNRTAEFVQIKNNPPISFQGQVSIGPDGTTYCSAGRLEWNSDTNTLTYHEGGIYKIDPQASDVMGVLFHYKNEGAFEPPTITSDHVLYLDDGTAINSSGAEIWTVDGDGRPAIGKEGIVYYKDKDSYPLALKAYVENQIISFSNTNNTINEGQSSVDINVIRSGEVGGSVSFRLKTDIPMTEGTSVTTQWSS